MVGNDLDFIYLNDRFDLIDDDLFDIFHKENIFDYNIKFLIINYNINNQNLNESTEIFYINKSSII